MADLEQHYFDGIVSRNNIGHIRQHIKTPGYIVNSDLPYIYNAAFAFLYTSLRESFGIPLLEAMACGTPVITSNTSSMPEIGSRNAILVNPESVEEITAMMLRLETDNAFYQQQKDGAHGDEAPVSYGLNTTLVKRNGVVSEEVR